MSNWTRDLQKMMEVDKDQTEESNPDLERLKSKLFINRTSKTNRSFYNQFDHDKRYKNSRGNCCFWHIIGAPQKDGKDMPMLSYQKLLYKTLRELKHHWIKKSRGLGVSGFLLRYLAYQCLTGEYPPGSRACHCRT
jgi:hypothetical protein